MTEAAELFNLRHAHFVQQGFSGAEVFEQLAGDAETPLMFSMPDQCAIEGVKLETMRKRRKRGIAPGYVKVGNTLKTPRDIYCKFLADRFTEGRGGRLQKLAKSIGHD
jgi:hypothetical protein